jgi:acyl dehydratase
LSQAFRIKQIFFSAKKIKREIEMLTKSKRITTPVEHRFFEDYIIGATEEYGYVSVTQEEIIDFARQFDLQYFHLDPESAKQSVYGGLIASGWHTVGLMMKLFVRHYLSPVSNMGSPGTDELRWLKPIRPGDTISIRVTVLNARRSKSKPDRGILETFIEVINQHHEIAMTMKTTTFCRCKPNK